MVLIAALALVLVNLWTLRSFREDKGRAIAGKRRIPERRLLELALIGGTPAAFLARHLFRHKTRKQPFSTYLQLIAMIQVGVIAGLAWAAFA
ncbi:DUF1294 domain-containing protein [Sphingomonas sp. S2-65]|uniref:DUF1294 domain-containing protein n=1 Tax=Sphingomonas sp. S2-65 TaxID=2903960 RepID=UPI001F1B57D3|nr:DUF1294 domain-containing protein [Sphingomonas sp. S2-65]UYY57545.1 DUF1294 domain-containing protein [Sphingomonas sp. S2-65]